MALPLDLPSLLYLAAVVLIAAYLFMLDLVGIGATAAAGLITTKTFLLALVILPPLMLGIWAGHRKFVATDPGLFRKLVLLLLNAMAKATASKAVFELKASA